MDTINNVNAVTTETDPFAGDVAVADAEQADTDDQAPVRTEAPLPNIDERSICLVVELSRLGNRRKVSTSQVTAGDADTKMINVSKRLLDSTRLKAIEQKDAEIRQYLYRKALPSLFKQGVYRIPIPNIERDESYLRQAMEERASMVEAFVAEYENDKAEAAERLRNIYNPMDYPDVNDVRASFKMRWRWINFSTPNVIQQISAQMWENERMKAQMELQEAANEIRDVLRMGMKELVDHMYDRLSGNRIFRDSMVKNMREFLEDFSSRNITDDNELQNLVGQARQLLDGVDPEALRRNETVKETVTEGMGRIRQCLDEMLQARPDRAITFDEIV